MTLHKLNPERSAGEETALPATLTLAREFHDLADTVIGARAIGLLRHSAIAYPVHRLVRCAARRKLEDVFDDLALQMGLVAFRLDEYSMLLDGPQVFIQADGRRKADYCSCWFHVWTDSAQRVEEIRSNILRIVGECYCRDQMFTIDWHFYDQRGLQSTSFDELCIDALHDEAYPALGMPVQTFIERYLAASETVLILQGPPGSGKTRLVRAILGALSARKQDSAKIMYTAEKKAMESDELFVDFITGSHDAFVIEDADHMLLARSDGNHDLHRFLAIADGVVRAQGRKIIFTTNLPNMRDIDEALLRPGRCYASVSTRPLDRTDAAKLLARIVPDASVVARLLDALFTGVRTVSVADIYRACARV